MVESPKNEIFHSSITGEFKPSTGRMLINRSFPADAVSNMGPVKRFGKHACDGGGGQICSLNTDRGRSTVQEDSNATSGIISNNMRNRYVISQITNSM
jgi:hypothetical protein